MKEKRESSAMADDFRLLSAVNELADSEASDAQREAAAALAVRLAYESGDRLRWALLLSRYGEIVHRGDAVPRALLEGLCGAFLRFCNGESMDEAFGLKRDRPGYSETMQHRLTAATNASLVEGFIKREGVTLEVALERAHAVRKGAVSEAQLKRDYYRHRAPVKRKQSK